MSHRLPTARSPPPRAISSAATELTPRASTRQRSLLSEHAPSAHTSVACKQRVCLRRTASSCLSCPVCGGLVARLCAARKHCRTGHEQAEALARSLVTRPLRVLPVSRFLLTRARDDHDGDTPGVGVTLVGCPGGLVRFFDINVPPRPVLPRLAALRCGSSARTRWARDMQKSKTWTRVQLCPSSSRAG